MKAPHSTTPRQGRGTRPFADLEALFEALPDGDLLSALQATRHTGRPGYAIPVVWRALVASFSLGIVHDTDLVRALESNPLLTAACGIDSPDDVPSKFAICRFRRKLAGFTDAVADVLASAVSRLRETLPDFGQTVAFDSTDVKAWANSFHHDTDPDAGIGAKKKGPGNTFFWYGYKVHVAVDAASELPIWFDVTPANRWDGSLLTPVLQDAQRRFDWFQPEYVTADKGYNGREVFRSVAEEIGAIPIIDVKHPKAKPRDGRPCEAIGERMNSRVTIQHCEREPYDPYCPEFGHCPKQQSWMLAGQVANPAKRDYFERYSPFPFGSEAWKKVYNKRVSVERVFSRLKGYRKLNAIRTRRMPKVWLHVALSLLTMNASAIVGARRPEGLRRCVT